MVDAEGPGSEELGPSADQARLEALRRQLYSRSRPPEALDRYLGAEARLRSDTAAPPPDDGSPAVRPAGVAARSTTRIGGRRRTKAAAACAALGVALVAWLWWSGADAAVPDRIAPPAAPGHTLLFHSRPQNPRSAPDKVTFDPADERMLFFAEGRRLAVALACRGSGSVRITAAEERFDFRCDDQLRTVTRYSSGPVRAPFLILGRTTGDVVWGLRVTDLPVRS